MTFPNDTCGPRFVKPQAVDWWIKVPQSLMDDTDLSDQAFRLFLRLDATAGADPYCWSSNPTLAKLAGKKPRAIQGILDDLEDRGFIARVVVDGPGMPRPGIVLLKRAMPSAKSPAADTDAKVAAAVQALLDRWKASKDIQGEDPPVTVGGRPRTGDPTLKTARGPTQKITYPPAQKRTQPPTQKPAPELFVTVPSENQIPSEPRESQEAGEPKDGELRAQEERQRLEKNQTQDQIPVQPPSSTSAPTLAQPMATTMDWQMTNARFMATLADEPINRNPAPIPQLANIVSTRRAPRTSLKVDPSTGSSLSAEVRAALLQAMKSAGGDQARYASQHEKREHDHVQSRVTLQDATAQVHKTLAGPDPTPGNRATVDAILEVGPGCARGDVERLASLLVRDLQDAHSTVFYLTLAEDLRQGSLVREAVLHAYWHGMTKACPSDRGRYFTASLQRLGVVAKVTS